MPSHPVKVAVIGTGNIGGTLGRAFARAGHDVTFGTRRPAESAGAAGETGAKVTDVAPHSLRRTWSCSRYPLVR